MTIGIVVALAAEARTLSARTGNRESREPASRRLVIVSGVGAERAGQAAMALAGRGVGALVSWGTAAGLDPALGCGTVMLPQIIIGADGKSLPIDEAWRQQAAERLPPLRTSSGPLAESPTLLGTPEAKRRLRETTGAAAADMESAAVGRVARDHGLPFLCVRVIVDTASDALPAGLPDWLNGDGGLRWPALLLGLLRYPSRTTNLLRLGQRFSRASRSLRSIARRPEVLRLPDTGSRRVQ